MKPFERDGPCSGCGREFKITGVALNPGAESGGLSVWLNGCRMGYQSVSFA